MRRIAYMLTLLGCIGLAVALAGGPQILESANATTIINPYRYEVEAGGCGTERDSEWDTVASDANVGSFSGYKYVATKFTAGASYEVSCVDLLLTEYGSPAMNLNVYIYSHDGAQDDPDSLVGTGSDSVAASTIGGTAQTVQFTGLSASITSGTTYWIVLVASATDGSNYVEWELCSTATIELVCRDADGSGEWTDYYTNRSGQYKLYGD